MRIEQHPIIDDYDKGELVEFTFDGNALKGYAGEPIAAALIANGVKVFRYTQRNEKPRSFFCGIGRCNDCVMVVDGTPNVKTCVTGLKSGMEVKTQYGRRREV
ncbi:sarcosine oxidase subunit alpha [Clostridia bacterium]|nr:sarcosine oxidase subunit alpha [Clostridia bacterium]GHU75827.1 sarcosine oxidase subunit alpha [Clostridia bacterium]